MKLSFYSLFVMFVFLSFQFIEAQNIDSLNIKAVSSNDTNRLNALGVLGDYYYYKEPKKSDSLYRVALTLAKEIKNELEECKLLSYIGLRFNETAQADSILYYQNKSLEIALKIGDSAFIASAYGNIGNAFLIKERHDDAIENYNKALLIFEKQRNLRLQGTTYGTFGNIYIDLKDYEQAILYNQKAKEIFKALNFIPGYASSTLNTGICYQRLEKYEEAIQYLEEAKTICEEHSLNRLLRVATLQLGNINYNYYKNYDQAKIQYEKTEALAIQFQDNEGIAQSNYSLGKIALLNNDSNKAILHYRKAVENFRKVGKKEAYYNAISELISALKKSGKNNEAIMYYDELITLNDSIFSESSRAKTLELMTTFDVSQKNKEIEIQNLKLEQQDLEIAKQRNIRIFFSVFSGLLIILLYFVWRSNKYKKLNQYNRIKSKRFELEQRLLRSQMNPHFIFNALNSIQSYVSENKTMDSEIYLSRFSHLMRQILEHSQEEFIILKDDFNALEAYVNLEQLRFENSFDYKFNTNDIDESIAMIPPMILQPFIENAILHGLEPKKSEGLIKVDIKMKKAIQNNMTYGVLICNIIDNGIGREAASKKDTSPNREHVSLALKLIKERLANYSEITNETYQITIEDLYENNIASGTKINIEMPYTQDLL
ncbi:tetratricopeptide repeat-containing sensor histidine kinase [Psychroserpens ponticola]|uniref:Tetratricopeptide repeat protein n=1 Tax=Psychroserpens ponticola TaxID=2932268 RepID=A0ABY7RY83_9FLAO|nr:tetratricopeptide repeat protein [Psychroserpens ponticola]WCO00660.1 tetratricopeptide repeat protein [Psychroserpens ponticola]